MINSNHELLLELWARSKAHIPVKERLEVAEIMVDVFDEFNLIDDSLVNEELDSELYTAVHNRMSEFDDCEEEDDDYGF